MKTLSYLSMFLMLVLSTNITIFDFNNNSKMDKWIVVDDGVMGGLSKGIITLNNNGHAVYSGYVTTDNNGGFSSVRYNFETMDVSQFKYVVLKIKGDGRLYQFRLKQNLYDRFSYIYYFETNGEWQEIKIPLNTFYPSYRGYKLNQPNFKGESLEEIAFLIGNKKKESFQLIIDRISLE